MSGDAPVVYRALEGGAWKSTIGFMESICQAPFSSLPAI